MITVSCGVSGLRGSGMTNIPAIPAPLQPAGMLECHLPSGMIAALHVCRPIFDRWTGPSVKFTFGGKMILAHEGKPVFAELLILRLLEAHGWDGVWVSSFGNKFVSEMPDGTALTNVDIPSSQQRLLVDIQRAAGRHGGCPDVFAWSGEQRLFCEAKRRGHDAIRPSQLRWIEAAISLGISLSSMLVVEWTIPKAASLTLGGSGGARKVSARRQNSTT
jgi:hypothetical protein